MNRFSVIVPVYNSSGYLKKCLDSLVKQSFKDLEIIVVNDGSTDDSESIVKEYALEFTNVFLYTITNHGQAYARNYGLSKASGEYISFVDSDDYVSLDLYEKMDKKLRMQDYDMVLFGYCAVDSDDRVLFNKRYECSVDIVSDIDYLFSDPCPWNKVYKKEFLDRVGFKLPEGIIYEDYCYIPTLINYSPVIGYVDCELYYYVYSNSSTTRNVCYKEKYEDLFEATDILYNSFIGTKYGEEIEYLIYYHFLYQGSLNFYKFNRYDMIDKIALVMCDRYPKWFSNKYVRKRSIKERILAYLFYKRKYKLIGKIQKMKGCFSNDR